MYPQSLPSRPFSRRMDGALVRTTRHRLLLCLAFVTLAVSPASASEPDDAASRTVLRNAVVSWDSGDRIRVTVAGAEGTRMTGWYSGLESDSVLRMHLDRDRPPVSVPLHRIRALEESTGRKRHVLLGMGLGLVAGVLVGNLVQNRSSRDADAFLDLPDLYPVIGGMAGLVVGGGVGFFVRSERWHQVASFQPGD